MKPDSVCCEEKPPEVKGYSEYFNDGMTMPRGVPLEHREDEDVEWYAGQCLIAAVGYVVNTLVDKDRLWDGFDLEIKLDNDLWYQRWVVTVKWDKEKES